MEDTNHSQTEQRQTPVYTSDKGTKARTTVSGRVQRTHKDTLFRFIFRDKEKLLKLYERFEGTPKGGSRIVSE